MKILWFSHFIPYPPTGHGALQRSHHLLKEVSSRHEVHLLTLIPPWTPYSSDALARAVRELSTFAASVTVLRMPASHHWLRRFLSIASTLLQSASVWEKRYWWSHAYRELTRVARTTRFDVVHADTVFLAPYLNAVSNLPIVLNHHNVESYLLYRRAASERSRWRRFLFTREARKVDDLERTIVPRVAENLVVSDVEGERLRAVAPGVRITIVANGVDVDFFQPSGSISPRPNSMIFAGGMNWFPNSDAMTFFASEIWPALVRDNPARTMTVVGRDPPRELRSASRDPRFRVTGFVDDPRPYVEAASLYVCPIRIGGGTRLKILDALSMCRPLVSTELAVEGLGLVSGTHYLSANTPAEFVDQISRLDADPDLRQRLSRAGRDLVVERYSWHRIADALTGAYRRAARLDSGDRSRDVPLRTRTGMARGTSC
jgi:sugar transferase (PEP-CTERM/EpsH1 system associated)